MRLRASSVSPLQRFFNSTIPPPHTRPRSPLSSHHDNPRSASNKSSILSPRLRAIVLGPPGGGKGTLSSRVIDSFGPALIGMGDLLRSNVNRGTEVGKLAYEYIAKGALLPDEVVLGVVEPELQEAKKKDWILDGLPRTQSQAVRLDRMLHGMGDGLNLVVNLQVPDDCILERIEGRWIHAGSGRVYNTTYNPPKLPGKDDVTGEELVKRTDDTAEVFKVRLAQFHRENEPLLEYYDRQINVEGWPKLIHLPGNTSDKIWPMLEAVLRRRFPRIVT